ncbi:hypothetical protein ACH4TX_39185 [Streptomyces sp. NPDC021098]|uniref:hypothetical protein n=1 Tax=unclassified Streptomyces TaxID=2593676 RepID=UPI00379FAB48
MDIAELVLKYIEALVWPAVTVGLVWGLRSHIREAFTRMTRLETPAGAIEFETQARDVLTQAEEAALADAPWPFGQGVPTPRPQPRPTYPPPAGQRAPHPERVEEGLGPYAPDQDEEPEEFPPPPPPPVQPQPSGGAWAPPSYRQSAAPQAEQLQEARTMVDASPAGAVVMAWNALLGGLTSDLPPDMVAVVNRLRTLRNRAVHQADTVTPGAARDFVESCLHVARAAGPTR